MHTHINGCLRLFRLLQQHHIKARHYVSRKQHTTHIGLLLHAMACKNIIQRSANQTRPLPGSSRDCRAVHTYPSQTSTVHMCTTPILPKPLLYVYHTYPSQTSTVHMCTTPILPKPLLYICVPHLSFPNLYCMCTTPILPKPLL